VPPVDPPEPETPWEFEATHRTRVAMARRARRRSVLVTAAVVVLMLVVGGLAWLLVGDGSEPAPRRAVVAPPTTSTTVLLRSEECREALSFDDPLRLWIGGDSLAGSLGPALGEQTADTGVVLPTFDSRTSSGLASPDFFDWPEHATEEMGRLHPEIVVFIIGANDFDVPEDESVDALGAPVWRAEYTQLLEEILGILEADERHVYLVGPPIMRETRKADGARELDALMREVVAFHPDVVYVSAFDLFGDENGEYTATLPSVDGEDVRVRTADGIHFTEAGGEFLADQVFALIDRRCDIVAQAIPGRRQPVEGYFDNSSGVAVDPPAADTTSSSSAPVTTSSSPTTSTTSTTASSVSPPPPLPGP
jgi:hypothetical protein